MKIQCLFDECKRLNLEFESLGFQSHLRKHNISRKEYAIKFNTNDMTKCPICEKIFYCKKSPKYNEKGVRINCCSKKCRAIYFDMKRRKDGYYESESYKRSIKNFEKGRCLPTKQRSAISKEGAEKRRARGDFENHEKLSKAAQQSAKTKKITGVDKIAGRKAADTRKRNGTDKIQIEKAKKWRKEHPDKVKETANKIAEKKRERGTDISGAIKGAETKERLSNENPNYKKNISKKALETTFKRFGKYTFQFPRFSLESQELFIEIEARLPKDMKCFYATNGLESQNEYQILCNDSKVRFLDFFISDLNKCIEFDERHHENIKVKALDKEREMKIAEVMPKIEIFRVKIKEYINDKEGILTKCLNFIFNDFQKTIECVEKVACL